MFGAQSGPTQYNAMTFLAGFKTGSENYTTKTAHNCASATWNPGSIATSTITNSTSTDIALTGGLASDKCSATLSSATSSAISVGCNMSGTATATIQITNLGTTNAAIDLATGTAQVCFDRN